MTNSTSPAGIDACAYGGSILSQATERVVADGPSRRRFLHSALAGSASGVLARVVATPRAAAAQSSLTPDVALQSLMDGNRRYVEGRLQSLDQDLKLPKQETAEKQEPFAAGISASLVDWFRPALYDRPTSRQGWTWEREATTL